MKRKIFSILFALVLVVGMSLVTAVPAVAEPGEAEAELVGSYSYSWTTSIMDSTDFDFTVGMGWSGPFPWPPNVYFFFHPDEIPLGGYTEPIGGAWLFENIDFDETAAGQTFSMTSVGDDPDFEDFASLLTSGTDEVIWFGYMGDRDNMASAGGQKSLPESGPGTDVPGWTIESVSLTFNQIYLDPDNANKLVLDFTLDIYAFPPTEVWVADTGSDDNPGTEALPFATIQKGIDTVAEGGTVNVAAGTYAEGDILIDKALTIQGAGKSDTIIDATGFSHGLLIAADDVTIEGLTVEGATYRDITWYQVTVSGTIIRDVKMSDATGYYGLEVHQSTVTGVLVEECDFTGNRMGLSFDSGSAVTDFTVDGCTFDTNYLGIYTECGISGLTVTGSSFANTFGGMEMGLCPTFENIYIEDSHFEDDAYGVYFWAYAGGEAENIHINYCSFGTFTQLAVCFEDNNEAGYGDVVIDAENNWWGDATGPAHASNPHDGSAAGAAVSDYVDFIPWYATATTTPATENVSVDHATPAGTIIAISDTIQGGIDAALADDTINVKAGTYNLSTKLSIDKALTLLGPNAGKNPNTGTRVDEALLSGEIVQINDYVNDVVIDGFKFSITTGKALYAALCIGDSTQEGGTNQNITVKNNWFTGGNCAAVKSSFLARATNLLVTDNKITDLGGTGISGLVIWGTKDSKVSNNVINGTTFGGILLEDVENVVVSGNTISNTPFVGIILCGCGRTGPVKDITISNNVISNTNTGETPESGGILLQGSPNYTTLFTGPVMVTRNTVTNSFNGLSVAWCEGSSIAHWSHVHYNNFTGNKNAGVCVSCGGGTLDATNNWWCHASGPSHSPGYGNPVSGNVRYNPWLLEEVVPGDPLPTAFDKILALNIGWTLISTDNRIDPAKSVGVGVTIAYNYTPSLNWFEVSPADVVPVNALYVKTDIGGGVGITYSGGVPVASSKDLEPGWNLISSATETGASAVLSPLRYVDVGDEQGIGLATLVSQGNYNQHSDSFYLATLTDWDWGFLGIKKETLNPFDGYWVYMNAAKSFGVIPE